MKATVAVLEAFSERREPGISRAEYLTSLKRDLAMYYGYNEFMIDMYLNMFRWVRGVGGPPCLRAQVARLVLKCVGGWLKIKKKE